MKRFALSFLVIFLASPLFVVAQQPYARYCPDPKQIFTGVALDENGKPRIELLVESSFEQRMQQERKLGSLPVTPVYDLVVRVVPTINEYCLPQYNENGNLVNKVDPPGTLPFTVYFTLGNEILLQGTATRDASQKTEKGEPYYEWEKPGWPNGIFVSEKLERVIKAVQENDPTLRIGVLVDRSHNDAERVEKPISFELCVPLAGGSPHKIVSMRGKSTNIQVSQMAPIGDMIREEGFESIQPFMKYSLPELSPSGRSYFAHFADLSNHDDIGWATFFGWFFVGKTQRPRQISACGDDGSQYFFNTARIPKNGGYAPYGEGVAFLNASVASVNIAMHEIGHSFGWLEDEYHSGFDLTLYYANCTRADTDTAAIDAAIKAAGAKNVNSQTRRQLEKFMRRAYWGEYGDTVPGCHVKAQVRPSAVSIMNAHLSDEFNVVSCGYLLRAITGRQELRPLWQECMQMTGVVKPTIIPGAISRSPLEKFLSWFAGPPSSASGLFAAVAAPVATDDARTGIDPSRFINVETFSADGSISAEIFERVGADKGEQTEWRKVEQEKESSEAAPPTSNPQSPTTTTQPPSPSTENLGINAESIFDTVFLDLKVNGKDGPITVEKRDRIVLSWISEGATRCRANWSRNDLKLSGTASGRITRPVTIKIACINAEGERADDAVQVLVDTESS